MKASKKFKEVVYLPVNPNGQTQSKAFTGWIGRNNIEGDEINDDAFPNFRIDTHSSKLRQGSITHRLSSNGRTWNEKKYIKS